jgi:peptidoglycan/xylan/chitin deacetylase (PgdA/CDA1 family)
MSENHNIATSLTRAALQNPHIADSRKLPWGRRFVAVLLGFAVLLGASTALAQDLQQLTTLETHLKVNPRDVNAINALGIELAKLDRLQEAMNTWRKGIDIDPTYVHLYNNIGGVLRRMGYLKESEEWYRLSLTVKPTYWTWYNLGLLAREQTKKNEAVAAFREALRLCPEFFLAREYLAQLEREIALQEARGQTQPSPESRLPRVSQMTVDGKPPVEPENQTVSQEKDRANRRESREPSGAEKIKGPLRRETMKAKPETSPPPSAVAAVSKTVPATRIETDTGGPVFFTFDGGADAAGIPEILEALKAHGVKSTFFLTGKWVENYSDLAIQILAAGHEIANHSLTHKNMAGWSKERLAEELSRTEQVFRQILGRPGIPYFRFPFGAQNARVEKLVAELGYHSVYWDIDTLDWKEPPVSSIISKVNAKLKPRAVILMHCGSKSGARALPILLDLVKKRGYNPIPLSSFDPGHIAAIPKR